MSWIQPGVGPAQNVIYFDRREIKENLGSSLGYQNGGTYNNPSLKCYSEYDPNRDKKFSMNWQDFSEDTRDFSSIVGIIADRTAKHYVSMGHSHFTDLLGGWSGYLARVDSILAWCQRMHVPVRTYQEWSKILYETEQNPYTNIFPKLNVDLDGNRLPDGYRSSTSFGTLDTSDGVAESGNTSLVLQRTGTFCYITDLAGLEKGENDFSIWTKGAPGDSVEVIFQLPGTPNKRFKFPAVDSVWTKYRLSQSTNGNTILTIPDSVSTLNVIISCPNYSQGTVKISGMRLHRKATSDLLPPWNLTATLNARRHVLLNWEDNSDDEEGFIVEKASGFTVAFAVLDTLPANVSTFVDSTSKDFSSLNRYRVRAFSNSALSSYTNEATPGITMGEGGSNGVAQQFALSQNYPNPFNPSTTIRYQIPAMSTVTIRIYNIMGQAVRTLLSRVSTNAGEHLVVWRGETDLGLPSSAGVYFYRIEASPLDASASFVETRKMILIH